MQLNKNIKLIRELSGKKQQEFASLIGTNLSNLKTYETTDVKPKANILAKVADIGSVSIDELETKKLTHKDITIKINSGSKKGYKVNSRETRHGRVEEDDSNTELYYHNKYISLLEKENEKKDKIIDVSLTELVMGQRISQAHLKTLLQITVTETAVMQGKDPVKALDAANKVVADTFSVIQKTGNDAGM